MSAMSLALLLAAATATAAGTAALWTTRGLRRQIHALRADLAAADTRRAADPTAPTVPAARQAPAEEAGVVLSDIRAAVADALAEERERELAEARAFWAAQEALDLSGAADAPSLLSNLPGAVDETAGPELLYGDVPQVPYLPRQTDATAADETDSPELAAARRRHPSHPDFSPAGAPVGDHERTVERLTELAEAGVPLADVRPGPLGTLDVYVFADGTTVCMTPGHRETAESLAHALRTGEAPVLLGGSGVAGAYALTFGCATGNVYVLADRVIASL
ncbi:hypothetical protein [Streptomyces huiliensis]|uniref:hypothetical protein n=1 Tax=Streptomyces huiliensis TaxID=2876027 RepID=UPI001CBF93EE|nr:hypothetical protein [Streptomyces huiliensis]MBZ4319054.1 hypothetical protein [Streptomyces huiliensis]